MKRMKVKIGDVCTLKSGTSLKDNVLNDTDGIPYIKVSDMNLVGNEKYIITANSYADESIGTKMLFPKGTILFPKRGGAIGTNKKRIANRVVCADLNTMGVIPSEKIRPLFLYYYFQNIDFGTLYNGSSVPQINNTDIAPMEIELLSLDEQDEAIAVLEKIDSIIRKRKTELKKLDNLIKARFVEVFGNPVLNEKGWDTAELNEVCDGIGDGLHGTPEYDDKGEFPFINGNNLIDGVIKITPATKFVNEEIYNKHYIEISDNAIFLSINGTLGKLAFYSGEQVMLGKSACYCNLKPEINKEFVYGVMKTEAFAEFLESNATASTIKNVGLKAIRGFRLILPPDELQNQFVEFAKQVDKSKFKKLCYNNLGKKTQLDIFLRNS